MNKKIFLYLVWIFWGVYGVIYNISFIDEAKYIIKGLYILNGEVSYYKTGGFFYQHMPGSLLWFGLGQKIFGQSLLIARIQSFLIGLFIPFLTYLLTFKITKKENVALISSALLTLSPALIFYYSTATPTSLIAFLFLLGFLFLFEKKYVLSSLFFTLLFIVRENFLFTLVFYLIFLFLLLRKNIKLYVLNFFAVLATLIIFIAPGFKGIINIFKNIPGLNLLLPISNSEKAILALNWQNDLHDFLLNLKAVAQFWSIYQLWLLIIIFVILVVIHKKWFKKEKIKIKNAPFLAFLTFIAFFNFLAHSYAAFKLSPRAIIHYFAYFVPLFAVIWSLLIQQFLTQIRLKHNWIVLFIFFFLGFSIPSLRELALISFPFKEPALIKINHSAKEFEAILPKEQRVVWLAEPITLYLARGKSFYPLINHFNFYKSTSDTKTVQALGFWNQEMLQDWLEEVNFVFVDPNKISILKQTSESKELVTFLESYLETNYRLVKVFNDNFWPKNLIWFEKKNYFSFLN